MRFAHTLGSLSLSSTHFTRFGASLLQSKKCFEHLGYVMSHCSALWQPEAQFTHSRCVLGASLAVIAHFGTTGTHLGCFSTVCSVHSGYLSSCGYIPLCLLARLGWLFIHSWRISGASRVALEVCAHGLNCSLHGFSRNLTVFLVKIREVNPYNGIIIASILSILQL